MVISQSSFKSWTICDKMGLLRCRSIFLSEDLDMKKDKRVSVSLSLTLNEKEELMKIAKSYGLSLSAFFESGSSKIC